MELLDVDSAILNLFAFSTLGFDFFVVRKVFLYPTHGDRGLTRAMVASERDVFVGETPIIILVPLNLHRIAKYSNVYWVLEMHTTLSMGV